jgi:hypothetical protein
MNGFSEGRMDTDTNFQDKEYRVSRERIDLGEEGVYEKISIFDEQGLVAGLEYKEDSFDDFEMLSQRDEENVEVYERGSDGEMSLDEFRETYDHLNSGGTDIKTDIEFNGTETAETYQEGQ